MQILSYCKHQNKHALPKQAAGGTGEGSSFYRSTGLILFSLAVVEFSWRCKKSNGQHRHRW